MNEKNDQEAEQLDFFGAHSPMVLKKPVEAIHMGITGGLINKTQRLAWNVMLKHAHDQNALGKVAPDGIFSIPRVKLMEAIGYTSKNRKHLKDTLKQMQDLKVEWDILNASEQTSWTSCVLMPMVGIDQDNVKYSYLPHLRKFLLSPEVYANLDIAIQGKLKLDSSVGLYDWVNRYRNNPSKLTNLMEWEKWRFAIYGEIDEEKSSLVEYKIFKRDKLLPAIKEINLRTDLKIELMESKDGGRKIKYLQFKVEIKPIFTAEDRGEEEEWTKKLQEMGISPTDRKLILERYTLLEIKAAYEHTVKRMAEKPAQPLKAPGAFLKHALKAGYLKIEAEQPNVTSGNASAIADIEDKFRQKRSSEAAGLFKEMNLIEQTTLISEFNAQVTMEGIEIPESQEKRNKRVMAPFFTWFARKTWGDPTPQEVLKFAMETGAVGIKG